MVAVMEVIAILAEIFLPAHLRGTAGSDMPYGFQMAWQYLISIFFEIYGSV